jgi:hypothetical protein
MRPGRLRRLSKYSLAVILALTAFVFGHNLYFLLQYGSEYTRDLARTGDGSSWHSTVRFVLASAALLTLVASVRLAFLVREARRTLPGRGVSGLSGAVYLRRVLPVWSGLFVASLLLFVLQENSERLSAGLRLPGIAVIGTDGPVSPILVFALVSLAFALVEALFHLGIDRLEALIAEGRSRSGRPARATAMPRRLDPDSAPTSVIGLNLAGRAPPTFACLG